MVSKMEVRWVYLVHAWFVFVMRRDVHAAYMSGFEPTALGSLSLTQTDDAWVDIPLSIPFPFHNKQYSHIFVNEDGILTLRAPIPARVPGSVVLPIHDRDFSGTANTELEQMVIISPFWTEVNTADSSSTGTVYYKAGLTGSDRVLSDAEGIVKSCFIDQDRFTATSGAVVTWDQVSDADNPNKKNSFQAILVYDRSHSFVIFYYSEMQYAKSSFSAMGFNAGDISGGLSYTYSGFGALPGETNCGNAGKKGAYVFRVDTEKMTSPGCQVVSGYFAVQVSPASGPMTGGNQISIAPNCDLTDKAVCVFQQGDTVLQTVHDVQIVDLAVICIPGPFFVTGDVSIVVYKTIADAEDPVVTAPYAVKYTIELPDDSTVGVNRSSPTSDAWNTAGSRLTITWDATLFHSSVVSDPPDDLPPLRVSIMQYDESVAGRIPTWDDVFDIGVGVDNSGTFSFTPESLENITEANPWGTIRVQSMDIFPVSLYSDVHMLGYLLHQLYQDNPEKWAGDECERWNAAEDRFNDANGMPGFLADVPPCPCTLSQARTDTGGFLEQRDGCAVNANDSSCTRRADSNIICFLSTSARAGAECCYHNTNGNLVFSLDDPTGGTSDKAGILGMPPYALPGQTPYLSHWEVDVVPYQLCCRWAAGERCRTYIENRWPKDCFDYNERESAFIFGDPHFVTFDQRRYTFNGIGEYRVMEVSNFDFKLYGRTTMATESRRDGFPVASYLNAVVMQETGSDTIHIELGQTTSRPALNLFYNYGRGFRQPDMWLTDNAYDPLYLKGATVTVNAAFNRIMVAFHASSIVVDVAAYTQSITAEVITSRADIGTSVTVSGLLGDLDGLPANDIRHSSTGIVYEGDDPTELFDTLQEWITVGDTIFHLDGVLDRSDYQNTTFVPTLVTPDSSTLEPLISNRLQLVCRDLQECIFDMSVTQMEEAGQECFDENAEYVERQRDLAKVETCPYIPGPQAGKVDFSDSLRQYAVGTSVTFTCDNSKSILFGPRTRNCVARSGTTGGAWSNSAMAVCTETGCGTDDVKGADVIETGTDSNGNLRVTFGCPNSDVQYVLTCEGGQWIGGRPDCSTGGGGLSGGAIAGVIIGVLLLVVLLVVVVVYLFRRKDSGAKDLEQSGTTVNENQPAENWGMDQEAVDASASKGANSRHDAEV